MKSYKKFVHIFVSFSLLFILFNFVIWTFYTQNILSGKAGDLARIGYIVSVEHPRKKQINLTRRHIEFKNYKNQKIDVLTIGDSFSNGGGGGLNPYYQDYLASINNFNVLNIPTYKDESPFKTLSILLNSGYLDKIKPEYLIIELVERSAINKLSGKAEFKDKISIDKLEKFYKKTSNPNKVPNMGFINNGNVKFLFYSILYNFSDHAFISQVYLKELKKPLFTSGNGKKISFFYDDLDFIPQATEQKIRSLNENLNKLDRLLKQKGIKLYFMPVVDKYNLYNDYILDNQYPESTFFEKLRKYKKDYYIIDTKEILSKELEKDEKDIFYSDDTHWTWKASKRIFEQVKFK